MSERQPLTEEVPGVFGTTKRTFTKRMAGGGIVDSEATEDYTYEMQCELCGQTWQATGFADVHSSTKDHAASVHSDLGPADAQSFVHPMRIVMAEGGIVDGERSWVARYVDTNEVVSGPYMHQESAQAFAEGWNDRSQRKVEVSRIDEMQEGGVVAVIGEAGPEAVIPLDDPDAVEVMADAISEGGADDDAVEAAVEIVEIQADAAVEIATVEAEAAVAIVEAETDAAVDIVEAEAEAVEEVAEVQAETAEAALETQEDIVEEVPTSAVAEEAVESAAEVVPDEAPGHTGFARNWWGD